MSRNECCVPGCQVTKDDDIPLHRFPDPEVDPERFMTWVTNIGGLDKLDNTYVYYNRRVCRKHFTACYLYPNKRLCKLAIPQLQLPGQEHPRFLEERPSTSSELKSNPICEDEVSLIVPKSGTGLEHQSPVEMNQLQQFEPIAECSRTTQPRKSKSLIKTSQKKIKFANSKAFQKLTKNLSPNAKIFFQMQVKESRKRYARGRRFTTDEKILALSLYKPSPKAYRILSKFCILPSRRTLQNLLHRVKLNPGYNKRIFKHLQKRVAMMPEKHKYCTLVFDEMAIAPSCYYDKRRDSIQGFVDDGEEKGSVFCDHSLVFMIRGILKKYKQPVYYTFSASMTKTLHLKKQIKLIVSKLQETGLKIVATICDQGVTNTAAMNSLMTDTRSDYLRSNKEYMGGFFEINNEKIYVLYDPPHLLKGIRNNLLTKNLKFTMKGREQIAKWSHIQNLYERSPGYRGTKLVPKLTAQHVVPALIPKMKVKHCTQVFSQSVGVALGYMAESGCLPKECCGTADLLIFFDNLFDSLNGGSTDFIAGKFRNAVTPKSAHHKLWRDSLPILRSMRYDTNIRNGIVPSLTSWVTTIENIVKIVKFLQSKGLNSILLRNLNQDALENFFGAIRAHGYANTMPNSSSFEAAYKTLLLNNLTSKHSIGANCEVDDGFCLDSIKYFLTEEDEDNENEGINVVDSEHMNIELADTTYLINSNHRKFIEKCAAIGYCSGWIALKAKNNIYKKCQTCHKSMESEFTERFHGFIKIKEYENKRWLCYPTRSLFDFFAQVEHITYTVLKVSDTKNKKYISQYIKLIISINIDMNFITCLTHKHDLINFLINKSTVFFINNWCKKVTHLLTGKAFFYDKEDYYKKAARQYYLKNRGRKRQIGVTQK